MTSRHQGPSGVDGRSDVSSDEEGRLAYSVQGWSCGTSQGQRVLFGFLVLVAAIVDGVAIANAVPDPVGALVFLLVGALFGCVTLQTGFHTRVSCAPKGVVFRGAFLTRAIPWSAVTGFAPVKAGGCVFANPIARFASPIASPDIQALRPTSSGGVLHQ
jgi:hypothetical protein